MRASDTPVSAAAHLSKMSSPVARWCMRVNSAQASKTVKLEKCARSRTERVGASGGLSFPKHDGVSGFARMTLISRPGTGSADASNNAVLLILVLPSGQDSTTGAVTPTRNFREKSRDPVECDCFLLVSWCADKKRCRGIGKASGF